MIEFNSALAIPSSFRYRKVYEKGKPVHERNDDFYIKHPPMQFASLYYTHPFPYSSSV